MITLLGYVIVEWKFKLSVVFTQIECPLFPSSINFKSFGKRLRRVPSIICIIFFRCLIRTSQSLGLKEFKLRISEL